MNASERADVLRGTDHVPEHGGNPTAHPALQEHRSSEQAPPRSPPGPYVPDEGTFETFVGGAGI